MKTFNVLVLCTHNSARSQMAEGLMNHLHGDRYQAYSAGTEPRSVHPLAVKVLAEIGIDISSHRSKHLREFAGREMDLVVTVCDHARAACPFFPWAKEILHKEFPDPSEMKGAEEQVYAAFRAVRDQITAWIDEYFGRQVPQ